MWLFRKSENSKRQLRAFSAFLSKEELLSLQEKSNDFPALQKEKIYYVVFQVRDETPESIQHCLSVALEVVLDHGGMVENVMSSVVMAVFKSTENQVESAVAALLSSLGPDVRAVCGYGEYLRGVFGSKKRFSYGTIIPNIHGVLQSLFQLDFGSSRNIGHSTPKVT